MSNATFVSPLPPGHARHNVFPVYFDNRGFYGCVTEVWMTDDDGMSLATTWLKTVRGKRYSILPGRCPMDATTAWSRGSTRRTR